MRIIRFIVCFSMITCRGEDSNAQKAFEFTYQFAPRAFTTTKDSVRRNLLADLIVKSIDVSYTGKFVNNYAKIDEALNADRLASANVNINVADQRTMFIDYEKDIMYLSSSDSFRAFPIKFPLLKKSNDTQDFLGYKCSKYVFEDSALRKYEIWASDSIPWFINPGYFDKSLKSGIVKIVNKEEGEIILRSFKEVSNLKLQIPITKQLAKTAIVSPLISQ